ncbi:VOC family protein [Kineothrix sp. MB12-C1]|uniref:VOC family protein n=1 Tax=Kineothrix sp. MB12-C1 TaxID=3070215 RepID=UPI0027D208B5|nr:VOC family protein [Kineothrix sp. MB12-C1]WMC93244.1 VOC family protein [Kineothrix sp. MB12-C1]
MSTVIEPYLHGIQHIGIPCANLEDTVSFYEKMGMNAMYRTANDKQRVCFLKQQNLVIEVYEEPIVNKTGAINHICFDVSDIEEVYKYIKSLSVEFVDKDICFLPFWDNGVKYFTILGPNNERIEFCQKL